MQKTFATVVMACVLAGMFTVSTMADELVFFSPVVGSNPGVTIAGVTSGGGPWVVRRGAAVLTDNGRLNVDVRGLVLPSESNTAGPVTQVAASVVCGDAVAASSGAGNKKPAASISRVRECWKGRIGDPLIGRSRFYTMRKVDATINYE